MTVVSSANLMMLEAEVGLLVWVKSTQSSELSTPSCRAPAPSGGTEEEQLPRLTVWGLPITNSRMQ